VSSIRNWEDILVHLGTTEDFLPFPFPITPEEKSANALVRLFRIAAVYNQGWVPNWSDPKEYKYFPYKYKNSGGSWSVDCNAVSDGRHSPSGVHFKTEELAMDAINKFPEIYNDYLMIQDM
jgi:hypothetical protein